MYAPVIYGFCRAQALQDADAADVTQDVLHSVSRSIGRLDYDPARGSFRAWLFTVTRNKICDRRARQRRCTVGTGDTAWHVRLQNQPDRLEEDSDHWNRQYEQRVFSLAAQRVRQDVEDRTWQAFWRTAVEGQRPKDVAGILDMSVSAVYLAKNRVLRRLKQKIAYLRDD